MPLNDTIDTGPPAEPTRVEKGPRAHARPAEPHPISTDTGRARVGQPLARETRRSVCAHIVFVALVLPRLRDRAMVVAKVRTLFAAITSVHPYAGRTRGLVRPLGVYLGVDGLLALAVWTRDIDHLVRELSRLRAEHQLRAVFLRVEGREAFDAAARATRDLGRAS